MALIKITGPVGNFREETKVTSTHTYNSGHTQVRTEKEISFRVGKRPVTMKNIKGIELTDGDEATVMIDDGDRIEPGQVICTLSGSSQNIVTGERVALNFVQTLSATATVSAQYAAKVAGTDTRILDTRKTIPGLRMAQK